MNYKPLIIALTFTLFFSLLIFASCFKNGDTKIKNGYVQCGDIIIPSDMKCIPGGKFIRGSERTSRLELVGTKIRDEYPVEKIDISTFLMDTYEVTFSQYQECVKANGCSYAKVNYGRNYSRPKQPMLGITWYQARDYCKWKKRRLPSEAEWEKTARGPNGDLYPWGNEIADCSKAIIKKKGVNGKRGCGTGRTWDIATKKPYRYGLYDIAGNSWEWVNDWYSKSYKDCGVACQGKDPKGPCGGKDDCPGHHEKIIRGGSWWWEAEYALGSNRRAHFPKNRPYHHYGFRCAADPQKK